MRESLCRKSFFPDIIKILKLAQGAVHPQALERRPDLLEDASLTLKEQKFLDSLLKEQGESRLKELEQLVREAVKSDETPGSDREYYQQMKKVKKLLNEKKATLQELKGYYKVLGALKQEI